jgi:hypothetical protein
MRTLPPRTPGERSACLTERKRVTEIIGILVPLISLSLSLAGRLRSRPRQASLGCPAVSRVATELW